MEPVGAEELPEVATIDAAAGSGGKNRGSRSVPWEFPPSVLSCGVLPLEPRLAFPTASGVWTKQASARASNGEEWLE